MNVTTAAVEKFEVGPSRYQSWKTHVEPGWMVALIGSGMICGTSKPAPDEELPERLWRTPAESNWPRLFSWELPAAVAVPGLKRASGRLCVGAPLARFSQDR